MNEILFLDRVDSTNSYLKQNYKKHENFFTVVAKEQTNGRGRLGRTWQSHLGDLTFSMLYKPHTTIAQVPLITLYAGMAAYNVLGKYIKKGLFLKWPNDLLYHNMKICGILSELEIDENGQNNVIIGVGINVNSNKAKADDRISLKQIVNTHIDIDALLIQLRVQLKVQLEEASFPLTKSFCQNWFQYSCYRDRKFVLTSKNQKNAKGKIIGINESGYLVFYSDKQESIVIKNSEDIISK